MCISVVDWSNVATQYEMALVAWIVGKSQYCFEDGFRAFLLVFDRCDDEAETL